MKVSALVKINSTYTRSINLERDIASNSVVESYIPTSRAITTLEKIQKTFDNSDMPRAWSLIGPYGSGKSSFAVFLSHLYGRGESSLTKTALKTLSRADKKLHKSFRNYNRDMGSCKILLTGSPEPLGKRLIVALKNSSENYWIENDKTPPKNLKKLKILLNKTNIATTEIIQCVKYLQQAVADTGGKGILIIIDELGKFLEYEARHPETNDIFLLQALAEHAYVKHEALLSLFVLQHQSFEQYAKGLGDTAKNEWVKVQGRFETIPFLESTEQTLRVISNAIMHDKVLDYTTIKTHLKDTVKILRDAEALPSTLSVKEAEILFQKCYPLHPVSALLLPLLCQKIAQNERTLFNYLGSRENYGFQNSLDNLKQVGDWIYPWEIYEYFIKNQSAVLTDHFTHRRWAEVVTAVDRLGDGNEDSIRLLKTIGLFNIVGSHSGFKASQMLIDKCLPTIKQVKQATSLLVEKSVIQFRKYSGEFRVWEGSDFDIEAEIEKERGKLGQFSIADHLNSTHPLPAVIARRFTIETGSLRFFKILFVDRTNFLSTSHQDKNPRIIFYLCEDKVDDLDFTSRVVPHFCDHDIVVKFTQGERFRIAISEIKALHAIQHKSQELRSDPIAQREFKDRLKVATSIEENLISEFIDYPNKSDWYWNQQLLEIKFKRSLQDTLSRLLNTIYKYTPIIKNELINRDVLSSQAAAARNKLLEAMVTAHDKKDLGIEKFPAEKPIYRAVLREAGIHTSNSNGEWVYRKPEEGSSIYNAWLKIEKFLESTEEKSRSFKELENILVQPPYGIKLGVLPILYLATYLVYQDEVALYEEGHYIPTLSKEVLERFVKTPELFKIQLFRIEGVRSSIFKQYISALFEDDRKRTIIQAIKPLATFIGNLNLYTQKTNDLSASTLKFRNAFVLANSPEELLFEGIPKALGFNPNNFTDTKENDFVNSLQDAIRELKNTYSKMLELQQTLLAQSLQLDISSSIPDIRRASGRYLGLDSYTVDTDGLKAFINRLAHTGEDDEKWFINVLMFLGRKSPEKWLDSDKAQVDARLSDYSRRLLDLEALRIQHDRTSKVTKDDFEVILLKSIKQGFQERIQPVVINASHRKSIDTIKRNLLEAFEGIDEELRLATLAELVDDSLAKYQSTNKTNKRSNVKPRKLKRG